MLPTRGPIDDGDGNVDGPRSKTRGFARIKKNKTRGNVVKDSSGSGSGRISAGFGSCGFRFGDDFSPTVFEFGFGFGLELKLTFYNMLIITCLFRLLNLFKIDS
jgi:hypothetical protein